MAAMLGAKRKVAVDRRPLPTGFALLNALPLAVGDGAKPYYAANFHDVEVDGVGHIAWCRVCRDGSTITRGKNQGWHACQLHLARFHPDKLKAVDEAAARATHSAAKKVRGGDAVVEVEVDADVEGYEGAPAAARPRSIIASLSAVSRHDATEEVTRLIVRANLPFSFASNPAFREFVASLCRKLGKPAHAISVPGRRTIAKRVDDECERHLDELCAILASDLAPVSGFPGMVNVEMDAWTTQSHGPGTACSSLPMPATD